MGQVELATFNPYADRYPHRRVITREQLHLAKLLRANDVAVSFQGNPEDELNYLALKGLREWLADPIVVLSVSIPVGVLSGLIANALTELVKGRAPKATDVLIELNENGTRLRYSSDGRRLSDPQFRRLVRALETRYTIAHKAAVPADPTRPVPIYLEHTEKIVAWGRLSVDDTGLKVDDALVVDDETWSRIKSGQLRGMSIGALVRRARCTVCGQSYFDCNHVGGTVYEGTSCGTVIEDLDLGEVSFVETPVNPMARITHLK